MDSHKEARYLDFNTSIDKPDITAEALRRVLQPIEFARGLPNDCYTENGLFEYERQRVFAGGWSCVGLAMDAPVAGDLNPLNFAGHPLLMVRDGLGTLRLYHNVCPHRGRILVEGPETGKKAVVCPYHRWSYGLEGDLIATPHIGGPGKHSCSAFAGGSVHLSKIRCAEWRGLVFADLSGNAESFSAFIEPLERRWRDFPNVPLVHTGQDSTITFSLDCNWKLAVENYCEAYHLPWVHPELNRFSPLDRHRNIVEESYAGQQSQSYAPTPSPGCEPFPEAAGLKGFSKEGAEYVALFPNVLLGLHRDHFFAVLILPDGPARTKERFEIFYFDESARDLIYNASRNANRDMWQNVFAEDRSAVEGMQRGRYSPGFDGGRFSPVMDTPTHTFHKWIAGALLHGR